MLTFFKKIFIWWNQETLGTKIQTFFFGKLIGKDSFGNKYEISTGSQPNVSISNLLASQQGRSPFGRRRFIFDSMD